MTGAPLLVRIRPRPEAISFRPWAAPIDGRRSVLTWCAERLAELFPSSAIRVCVVAPWEMELARASLSGAAWDVAASSQWTDVDAWLGVASRLGTARLVPA